MEGQLFHVFEVDTELDTETSTHAPDVHVLVIDVDVVSYFEMILI